MGSVVLCSIRPKRILVIGIGSGGTPYNAGVNPQTEYVLAVEIVGSVLPTLKAYAQETGGQPLRPFLADPRYEMVVGDGRRELALSETRFDVIEADAIYPWRSHAGLLYSKEFFEEDYPNWLKVALWCNGLQPSALKPFLKRLSSWPGD